MTSKEINEKTDRLTRSIAGYKETVAFLASLLLSGFYFVVGDFINLDNATPIQVAAIALVFLLSYILLTVLYEVAYNVLIVAITNFGSKPTVSNFYQATGMNSIVNCENKDG